MWWWRDRSASSWLGRSRRVREGVVRVFILTEERRLKIGKEGGEV